jgi:hypothetical protein
MDSGWPDAEDTLLTDLLLPADECVLELPRASVDQTDPGRRAPEPGRRVGPIED